MQISLDTAKKLNWLWKDENKIAWIETFIKITDKETHTVPFILTDEQRNKAMLYLAEQKNPPAGRIAAISLTAGKPPHELFRLEC